MVHEERKKGNTDRTLPLVGHPARKKGAINRGERESGTSLLACARWSFSTTRLAQSRPKAKEGSANNTTRSLRTDSPRARLRQVPLGPLLAGQQAGARAIPLRSR
ncbi:hypothetical protein TRVL_07584 [Trypanosoma vivax]|nr:hypothetical protein TRVL_07584 [Trypanosoma vivax]